MKYEVIANENYKKYLITDKELSRIPKEGEKWTIKNKVRLDVLLGENSFKVPLIKSYKEIGEKNTKKVGDKQCRKDKKI